MIFLLVEIFFIFIVLYNLIVMCLIKKSSENVMYIMMFLYIVVLFMLWESNWEIDILIWNYSLKLGYIERIMKVIILIFMINFLFIKKNYFKFEKLWIKELSLILLLCVIGVFFVIMSNEFFMVYLSLELTNLVFYTLTNLGRWRSKSIESGLKYYIMGSYSSGLLLYGIILIFGQFGTMNFIELSYLLVDIMFFKMDIIYLIFIFLFVLIGLLFKLGVAPFHWWIPEVYEGAPVIVTLFFSFIPKISLLVILYKYYIYILVNLDFFFNTFFFWISIFSVIIGFFFSLYQKKVIKFIAYSSIFHVGFLIACLYNGTYLSLISMFYFLIPYMFLLLSFFFVLIIFSKLKQEKFIFLGDLNLLLNSNEFIGLVFGIIFCAFAGIPPLSGFFSKFFILFSLFLKNNLILFFFLLGFSVFSSFYYFRVLRFLFFSEKLDFVFLKPYLISNVLILYIFFTVFFFIFFDYLFLYFFLNLNFFFI